MAAEAWFNASELGCAWHITTLNESRFQSMSFSLERSEEIPQLLTPETYSEAVSIIRVLSERAAQSTLPSITRYPPFKEAYSVSENTPLMKE